DHVINLRTHKAPSFADAGPMKLLRIYFRVLQLLGRESRLAWALALANLALASAMFVEPILFGRIVDTLANAQPRVSQVAWRGLTGGLGGPDDAGGRVGQLRALHHHLQHVCGAACGPTVAPPVSGGAHHVLRTRAAAAAELSHRLAFRAAGEGDDHRHEYAVG